MLKIFLKLAVLASISFFAAAEDQEIDNMDAKVIHQELIKISDNDMTMGDKNALVTFIEYSSLSCPHCQKFHQEAFVEIKKKYIDTGKVLYIYRPFPTNKSALAGSMLAMCSGKEKYFQMLNALFTSQSSWAFTDKYKENLLNIAKLSGMTQEAFNACIDSKENEKAILKNTMLAAKGFEVTGTPFFIINGEKVEGDKPTKYFTNIIDNNWATANAIAQNKLAVDGAKK